MNRWACIQGLFLWLLGTLGDGYLTRLVGFNNNTHGVVLLNGYQPSTAYRASIFTSDPVRLVIEM